MSRPALFGSSMTAEQVLARPVPGKWSTQECVGHLADTEIFFTDRIVRTIAMDHPLLMSADEMVYLGRLDYQGFDLEEQLALFTALRRHAVRILRAQPPEAWNRTAVHSNSGLLTLRQLHPTRERRQATIGFGAVELGYQTLAKLARHVEG